jgi:quercetin dioxygenase-like cupin family protein
MLCVNEAISVIGYSAASAQQQKMIVRICPTEKSITFSKQGSGQWSRIKSLLCAMTLLNALSCIQLTEKTKMATTKSMSGGIFPKGKNAPADYFTGTVYLQMLAQKTESNDYSIGSVTFEPGARSNWHTHPAGQTLIVISGEGRYQEKGKPIKTINKGETIICPPNLEHWHGATPDSQMTHIAITNDQGSGNVVWLKPVTDDEYNGR